MDNAWEAVVGSVQLTEAGFRGDGASSVVDGRCV